MKYHILLFVFLTNTVIGFAQLSVFNKYLPFNQKADVYPVISNPDAGVPLIFISGKEIRVNYLGEKCRFQKELILKKPTKHSKKYLGSYIIDSSLIITFSDKKLKSVAQLIVNLRTDSTREISRNLFNVDQKHLATWETCGILTVLSIAENTNSLIVSKFYGEGKTSQKEYDFNDLFSSGPISQTTLFSLFNENEGKLQKIDNSMPVSLGIASAKNKVYLTNDELIITIDMFEGFTYYLSINLSDSSHQSLVFTVNNLESENLNEAKSNSFIYNNTLFQLCINKFELGLKVQSLTNTNKVVYFHSLTGKNIDFSNSSMITRNEKEGFPYGDPVVRNIKKPRKFKRIISRMRPAISVFRKQTDFQILMGGIIEIQQAKGVISATILVSGGEMIVGPGGNLVMPDPIYNFPSNYSFSSYPSRKIAYFSSLINANTFIHSRRPIAGYTYDYIFDYANYLPGRIGMVTIFKMKGDYYLGYYSYTSHTYNIEWFKNIDDHVIRY